MSKGKVQIIPLGGLGEIGKNMTVIRVDDEILLIDAGLMFPEEDMLARGSYRSAAVCAETD